MTWVGWTALLWSHSVAKQKKAEIAPKETTKEMGVENEDLNDFETFSESDEGTPLASFSEYHFRDRSIYDDEGLVVKEGGTNIVSKFPYNVYFKTENFITDRHFKKQYETITW